MPAAERQLDLTLPNGLVGKGAGEDAIRSITIRELDGADEDMLRDEENLQDGNILNRLLKRVIMRIGDVTEPKEIASAYAKHMTLPDTTFILVKMRMWGIDAEYRFDYSCPQCKKISKHKLDLSKLEVKDQDVEYRGLSELSVEHEGHVFEFRPLMAEKDTLLLQSIKEDYPREKSTRELLMQLRTVDGEKVDAPSMKKLSWRVRNLARQAMDKTSGGIDTELEMRCRRCNAHFKDSMPVQLRDFFFPAVDLSECQTAKPFLASGIILPSSDADGDGSLKESTASA